MCPLNRGRFKAIYSALLPADSFSSRRFTISSRFHSLSVTPASIAGVTFNVRCIANEVVVHEEERNCVR